VDFHCSVHPLKYLIANIFFPTTVGSSALGATRLGDIPKGILSKKSTRGGKMAPTDIEIHKAREKEKAQ
jgi:hypothetical protein